MGLVAFTEHGTGDATAAADYLLGERDHTGEVRAEVKVLRGDPYAVAQAANSLPFKNKYRSGVWAWAPEDNPSDEEIEETCQILEQKICGGLDSDRVPFSLILHRGKDGSVHIHIFSANVDLQTGKHYNPAAPGWEKSWGALKDYLNLKFSWADPSDPSRARTFKPGKGAKIAAAERRMAEAHAAEVVNAAEGAEPQQPKPPKLGTAKGKQHIAEKAALNEYIEAMVKNGVISDRASLVEHVKTQLSMTVARSGKNKHDVGYITFVTEDGGARYRMEGTLYDESFTASAETSRGERTNEQPDQQRDNKPDQQSIDAARAEFERYLVKHAEYNAKRYAKSGRSKKQLGAGAGLDPEVVQDVQGKPEQAADRGNQQARERLNDESAEMDEEVIFDDGRLLSDLDRNARTAELDHASSTTTTDSDRFDHRENDDQWEADASDQRSELDSVSNFDSEPAEPAADNTDMETLSERMNAEREVFRPEDDFENLDKEVMYEEQQDRNRNPAYEFIEQIEQRISAARAAVDDAVSAIIARSIEQVRSTVHSTSAAVERFVEQVRKSNDRVRASSSELESLTKSQQPATQPASKPTTAAPMNNDPRELDRFKSEINLTEFLMADGFQMDKKESSKSSHVMRRGAEKIIVSRQPDNHFVYFNVHDDTDHGTIIDYLKYHKDQNLGQARKELRPWIGTSPEPSFSLIQRNKKVLEKPEAPKPVQADQARLLQEFFRMDAYEIADDGSDYLQSQRKIDPETIKRFQHAIGVDREKSVTFLHTNSEGEMTGWERKNLPDGRSGFAAGGKKSLFDAMAENDTEDEKRLVIVESAIDALSFNEMYGRDGDRYVSFGGSMSDAQKAQLKMLVESSPSVLIAVDSDQMGTAFSNLIKSWRDDCDAVKPPEGFKDWNEYLQAIKGGDAELDPNLITPNLSSGQSQPSITL